jgi:hypothetical protein
MNTDFLPVFNIELRHSFYTDALCSDFELFPLAETQLLMRNRQAIFSFRKTFGKMMMLADATTVTTAAHPISGTDALLFGMTLLNPALANITTEWPSPKKIFLFTNADNLTDPATSAVTLSRQEISLSPKVIVHAINESVAGTATLKNDTGALVATQTFGTGLNGTELPFDVQHLPSGLYTVTETTTDGPVDYLYYADNQLLFKNIFGLIRIVNQPAFPFSYDGKPVYRVSFTPKSAQWKYYVVAPAMSGADIGNLSVVQTGAGSSAIVFTKTYPVPAADKTAPILSTDTSKVALFTSNLSLAYQQAPRKQIELRKGSATVLSNLPNPDIRQPATGTTEMFIYV